MLLYEESGHSDVNLQLSRSFSMMIETYLEVDQALLSRYLCHFLVFMVLWWITYHRKEFSSNRVYKEGPQDSDRQEQGKSSQDHPQQKSKSKTRDLSTATVFVSDLTLGKENNERENVMKPVSTSASIPSRYSSISTYMQGHENRDGDHSSSTSTSTSTFSFHLEESDVNIFDREGVHVIDSSENRNDLSSGCNNNNDDSSSSSSSSIVPDTTNSFVQEATNTNNFVNKYRQGTSHYSSDIDRALLTNDDSKSLKGKTSNIYCASSSFQGASLSTEEVYTHPSPSSSSNARERKIPPQENSIVHDFFEGELEKDCSMVTDIDDYDIDNQLQIIIYNAAILMHKYYMDFTEKLLSSTPSDSESHLIRDDISSEGTLNPVFSPNTYPSMHRYPRQQSPVQINTSPMVSTNSPTSTIKSITPSFFHQFRSPSIDDMLKTMLPSTSHQFNVPEINKKEEFDKMSKISPPKMMNFVQEEEMIKEKKKSEKQGNLNEKQRTTEPINHTTKTMNEKTCFLLNDNLPNECLIEICSYLQPTDILSLIPCNRICETLFNDDIIWEQKIIQKFGGLFDDSNFLKLFETKLDDFFLSNITFQDNNITRPREGNEAQAHVFDNISRNSESDNEDRDLQSTDDENENFDNLLPLGEDNHSEAVIQTITHENNQEREDEILAFSANQNETTLSNTSCQECPNVRLMFDQQGMRKGNVVKQLQILHRICLPNRYNKCDISAKLKEKEKKGNKNHHENGMQNEDEKHEKNNNKGIEGESRKKSFASTSMEALSSFMNYQPLVNVMKSDLEIGNKHNPSFDKSKWRMKYSENFLSEDGSSNMKELFFLFEWSWVNWLLVGGNYNKEDCCYVGLYGAIYDVTTFLPDHPGSKETLLDNASQDATKFFQEIGHSSIAKEMLKNFLFIAPDTRWNSRRSMLCSVLREVEYVHDAITKQNNDHNHYITFPANKKNAGPKNQINNDMKTSPYHPDLQEEENHNYCSLFFHQKQREIYPWRKQDLFTMMDKWNDIYQLDKKQFDDEKQSLGTENHISQERGLHSSMPYEYESRPWEALRSYLRGFQRQVNNYIKKLESNRIEPVNCQRILEFSANLEDLIPLTTKSNRFPTFGSFNDEIILTSQSVSEVEDNNNIDMEEFRETEGIEQTTDEVNGLSLSLAPLSFPSLPSFSSSLKFPSSFAHMDALAGYLLDNLLFLQILSSYDRPTISAQAASSTSETASHSIREDLSSFITPSIPTSQFNEWIETSKRKSQELRLKLVELQSAFAEVSISPFTSLGKTEITDPTIKSSISSSSAGLTNSESTLNSTYLRNATGNISKLENEKKKPEEEYQENIQVEQNNEKWTMNDYLALVDQVELNYKKVLLEDFLDLLSLPLSLYEHFPIHSLYPHSSGGAINSGSVTATTSTQSEDTNEDEILDPHPHDREDRTLNENSRNMQDGVNDTTSVDNQLQNQLQVLRRQLQVYYSNSAVSFKTMFNEASSRSDGKNNIVERKEELYTDMKENAKNAGDASLCVIPPRFKKIKVHHEGHVTLYFDLSIGCWVGHWSCCDLVECFLGQDFESTDRQRYDIEVEKATKEPNYFSTY